MARHAPREARPPFLLVSMALAGILGLALAIHFQISSLRREERTKGENQLSAIAELKVAQLSMWRNERLADAHTYAHLPTFSELARKAMRGSARPATARLLQEWLGDQRHYDQARLLDTEGREILVAPKGTPSITDRTRIEALATQQSGKPILMDFFRCPHDQRIYMQLVTPVPDNRNPGRVLGSLVLRIDPREALYPIVLRWPTPSQSAETLLVRQEGQEVVFLNDLRFAPGSALSLRAPLGKGDLPAAMAVRGMKGIVEGRDYRQVPVLADLRPIPESPWFLVTRMDQTEVFASFRRSRLNLLLIGAGLTLAVIAGGIALWRNQRAHYYNELFISENRLRESDLRFRHIVEEVPFPMMIHADDGGVVLLSRAWTDLSGYSHKEIPTLAEWTRKAYGGRQGEVLAEIGTLYDMPHRKAEGEYVVTCKDGSERTWDFSSVSLGRLLDGRCIAMSMAFDVTERKQAEAALAVSEARSRTMLKTALDGVWLVDPQGRFLDVNDAACAMLGYSKAEMLAMTIADVDRLESVDSVKSRSELLMERGSDLFEATHTRKDGTRFPVEISVTFQPEQGQMVAFVRDISERKEAEAERSTVANLLALIDEPGDFHEAMARLTASLQTWSRCEAVGVRLRADGDYPYFETRGFPEAFIRAENSLCSRTPGGERLLDNAGNPVLECMCGNVICGRTNPALPFFTPHGSFWSNGTTALLASTSEKDRQARTRNRCNGEGYESVALIPLRIGGQAFGLLQFNDQRPDRFTVDRIASFERIGDSLAAAISRRQTMESLRESEYFFKESQRASQTGSYSSDLAKGFWKSSEVLDQIFGIDGTFTRNLETWLDLVHPEDREWIVRYLQDEVIGQRKDFDKEYRIIQKVTGELRWVHGRGAVRFDADGTLISMTGTIRDITEKKRLEEEHARLQAQLLQAQKMESLGSLAGGVAHDMNNVLGAILGIATANLHTQTQGTAIFKAFDTIAQAATRGGRMVQSLLGFARQSPAEEQNLDLNDLLLEEVTMLERTTMAKVRLEMDLASDLQRIRGDASALTHAFMNLCINAVDAMPEGGTLTLRSRNIDPAWVEVVVEDTGIGMPKEILDKALDPFFTTKEVGKGTGLGLSMVYRTTKAHQGQLEILSAQGQGTQVKLRFPTCETPAPTPELLDGASVDSSRAGLTVLIVDDDDLIRITSQSLVESLGHIPVAVASGEEAMARLEGGLQPDLVLLDMNMPGWGGAGTLPRLRALRPALPVLLATGRVDQAATDLARAHAHVSLLPKPYRLQDLVEKMESALAAIPTREGPPQGN